MIHESVSAAAPGLEGAAGKHRWGNAERAELETETGGPFGVDASRAYGRFVLQFTK